MKNNTYLKEVVLSLPLVSILIVFMNPFDWFIPVKVWLTLLTFFVVLFTIFSLLLWNIKPQDEREGQHVTFASRLSFLVGSFLLTTGIAYQSFRGNFDYWLPLILIAMIVTKVLAILYLQNRN